MTPTSGLRATSRPSESVVGDSASVGDHERFVACGAVMSLRPRIDAWLTTVPFVPFAVVASDELRWIVESPECLTLDASGATLCLLVRSGVGWRDAHVRISQVVAVERDSTDLGPNDFRLVGDRD